MSAMLQQRVAAPVRYCGKSSVNVLPRSCGPSWVNRLVVLTRSAEPTSQPSYNGVTSTTSPATTDKTLLTPDVATPIAQPQPSAPSSEPIAATPAAEPSTSAKAENFEGDMLKPSVVNTPLVRALALMGAVAAVALSTQFLPARLSAFLHVSAYGIWLGTVLWNTFFVGLTMFKNMPRQMFGRVQSKLFPMYFSLTGGANLLALTTLVLAGGMATGEGVRAVVALGVSLAAALVNWLWLEPKCTTLMFERYDLENKGEAKTAEDKDRIQVLYREFGKWHGVSSVVNLVIFMVVAAHGWFLAGLVTLAV